MVAGLLIACSGFLLAVLWMDLIFDTQAAGRRPGGGQLPEPVLSSIAAYYRRATTTSQPMGRLIAAVMLVLLGALGFESVRGDSPAWLLIASGLLAGGPILLALIRTVPHAVRLGRRSDDAVEQTRLACAILGDHVLCALGMLAFLVLWLVDSAR